MRQPRTIADVITEQLGRSEFGSTDCSIPAPAHSLARQNLPVSPVGNRLLLGVASTRRHMTSENWQLQLGLAHAGFIFCGYGLPEDDTNVYDLVQRFDPSTVVIYDKREWDGLTVSSRDDRHARFKAIDTLRHRSDIFKATVLKDAHHLQMYYHNFATEVGLNAWITFYHPAIVHALAPYTRRQHLIRTYHCIDRNELPPFLPAKERAAVVLSGAVSGKHYPLRYRLYANRYRLPECQVLNHPGYGCDGTLSPQYLRDLNKFKVSICTSSVYGYALRKIMESTAVGCRVLTDLPSDEILPEIDANLVRIHPQEPLGGIVNVLNAMLSSYDEERQRHLAMKAAAWYDFRSVGERLALDIEDTRERYAGSQAKL